MAIWPPKPETHIENMTGNIQISTADTGFLNTASSKMLFTDDLYNITIDTENGNVTAKPEIVLSQE